MKTRTLALLLVTTSALVGPPAFAAQPYAPVIATYDTAGADDAELKAFVDSLQKAIDSGDAAFLKLQVAKDLAIYAPPVGFPDASTPGPLSNPDKHVGDQRLDEAAILMGSADADYTRDDLDSMVIDLFGTAIEPQTLGKSKIAGDRLCSPAEPIFDRDKALEMATAADVPPGNLWILSDKTDFHEKPDAKSPVVETLPAHSVVPFIEGSVDVPADGTDEADDGGWYSVALPSGKTGYASDDASLGFQAVSVCYGKVEGHWAVTAVIVPSL
ncbi:MAG TPA: SH3 domain-containing protein [Kaistia sp.]|nr:SH3 domain-containing protein [Kaistia sp.]